MRLCMMPKKLVPPAIMFQNVSEGSTRFYNVLKGSRMF